MKNLIKIVSILFLIVTASYSQKKDSTAVDDTTAMNNKLGLLQQQYQKRLMDIAANDPQINQIMGYIQAVNDNKKEWIEKNKKENKK